MGEILVVLLGSTLRVSTPLLFTALGGMFCERSGVINIALEGMMLMGAFCGVVVALQTHSPWLGFLFAGFAGMSLAAVYGLFVIGFRSDQVVAGTAINLLAAGIPPFVTKILYNVMGSTPSLPMAERFASAPLWLAGLAVIFSAVWMRSLNWGLWVGFAGEHPAALEAAGIRVNRTRWGAVLTGGFLAGLGGGTLSLYLASSYSRNMTAGRGFMALAALILGKWKPIPTAIACLFFGLTDALQIRFQGMILWGAEPIPVQFIQVLPYVVTVLVLAGFVGQSRAPKYLGSAY